MVFYACVVKWGCKFLLAFPSCATCPSCTLRILVIFEEEDLPELPDFDDEESSETGLEKKVKDFGIK